MKIVQFNDSKLAINEGVVRVYDCDPETHEYVGFSDEFLMSGVGLPANSYLEQPPEPKEGFAICRLDEQWQYVIDYRGQTVYHKQTRQEEVVSQWGQLSDDVTLIKPTTEFDYWDGQGWQTNFETQKQHEIMLAETKIQQRLQEAEKNIALLQRAVKLELATEQEQQRLIQWERYSVLLSRLDVNDVSAIVWPDIP